MKTTMKTVMKCVLLVTMLVAALPLNGCLKLGAGGAQGSPTGAAPYQGGGGPAPLIGSLAVDLRKK